MIEWQSWSLEFDDRTPIYRQIIRLFSSAFARGEIVAGERIPSIREMAALLKVNTNTMQRVYQEMERDNLIISRRGTGYFFTEDISMIDKTRKELALESLKLFLEAMRSLGFSDNQIIDELTSFMKGG